MTGGRWRVGDEPIRHCRFERAGDAREQCTDHR
jgi:hypothetical protein